ncbi:hypothetical protein CJA_2325 [Cellvibrio japonicus Ueda107]|uniref:Uncharacterized protein n=1 Tax=Cellvibrio japonicus (strain Ueda107) TaxID=498211 RepID=B3PJW3_CELJU|nr:hypothetical protein CJA_2325 [Cellvibrio japonicus Ueda107]
MLVMQQRVLLPKCFVLHICPGAVGSKCYFLKPGI